MIVVTGSSGFIGSNLVRKLYDMGKDVACVDYIDREYNFEHYNKNGFKNICRFHPDDFYEMTENYIKRFDIEMIFHEGGISSTTETNQAKLNKYNIECTTHLIEFCKTHAIPLQYASSASVYGNPTRETWDLKDKPLSPLNLYAKSKTRIDFVAENVMRKFLKKPIQGMRYFNVYGPNEDHKKDQASPYHKFNKQFKETGKIKLFEGSKEFYRDFISVEELIEKKLYCIENKESGIYDVGTGNPKSFYDVAMEICGSEEYVEWVPMPDNLKEHYQKYTKANIDWL